MNKASLLLCQLEKVLRIIKLTRVGGGRQPLQGNYIFVVFTKTKHIVSCFFCPLVVIVKIYSIMTIDVQT